MNIIKHHHINGELQRSEVEDVKGLKYVRIAAAFGSWLGELLPLFPARWMQVDGKVLRDVNKLDAESFEQDFVAELIELNQTHKPSFVFPADMDEYFEHLNR